MPARKVSSRRVSYATWQKMTPAQQAAKKRSLGIPSIRGQGAYSVKSKSYSYAKPGAFGKVGRTLGRAIGQRFGGDAGGSIGNKVGGLAHYIGRIFGSGDYVSKNMPKSNTILSPQVPSFSSGNAVIRVRHREFLGDVISSATANTFDLNSFAINPGLVQSFPWLSQVAGSTFQQYKLNGMVFEFRSMSSDALNSTNTALGQVIMCTDYDSADVPFSSKQQMENTEFGVSCKPSMNMIHAIECAPGLTSVTEKYVRAYSNPTGTDIRLYDMGKFYIATNGCQGTSVNLGELWVSYDVTFMKSIDQVPLYAAPYVKATFTGVSSTLPFGSAITEIVDQIGVTFKTDGTITFPLNIQSGAIYEVYYYAQGDSTASVAPIVVSASSMDNNFADVIQIPYLTAASSTIRVYSGKFRYRGKGTNAAPPLLQFNAGITPTNNVLAFVKIYQVSGNTLTDNSAYMLGNNYQPPFFDIQTDGAPEYIQVEEQKRPVTMRNR